MSKNTARSPRRKVGTPQNRTSKTAPSETPLTPAQQEYLRDRPGQVRCFDDGSPITPVKHLFAMLVLDSFDVIHALREHRNGWQSMIDAGVYTQKELDDHMKTFEQCTRMLEELPVPRLPLEDGEQEPSISKTNR